MIDLNSLSPGARSAAMRGGTSGWGQVGGLPEHLRYMELRPEAPRAKAKVSLRMRYTENSPRHGQRRLLDDRLRAVHPALD